MYLEELAVVLVWVGAVVDRSINDVEIDVAASVTSGAGRQTGDEGQPRHSHIDLAQQRTGRCDLEDLLGRPRPHVEIARHRIRSQALPIAGSQIADVEAGDRVVTVAEHIVARIDPIDLGRDTIELIEDARNVLGVLHVVAAIDGSINKAQHIIGRPEQPVGAASDYMYLCPVIVRHEQSVG